MSDDDWKSKDPGPALRPRRGGTPSPENTLYRERDVDRLYEQLLAGESVVLTAEKRVGKTATVKLLRERSNDEMVIVYRDVEGVGTPRRLIELLCQDLDSLLTGPDKAKHWLRDKIAKMGGSSLGPITLPAFDAVEWRREVNEVFDAVAKHLDESGTALVLVWDEAPWMVDKVRRDCGWEVAADLLDELRQLRQRHASIRFVFTGSIGFHHVLRGLRDGRSHRQSINEMRQSELPPLAPADADRLAWRLLKYLEEAGARFGEPVPDIAEHVATCGEGIPWFLHAIVDDLGGVSGLIDRSAVDRVVREASYTGSDSWHLRHYVERLDAYYEDEAVLAGRVLDAIAVRTWTSADEVVADLAHGEPSTRDDVLRLLRLLQEDHYLEHRDEGWRFRYRLIRDAWIAVRELGGVR